MLRVYFSSIGTTNTNFIVFVITIMQGTYNYKPETDHVFYGIYIVLQLFCIYNLCYT